MSKLTNQNEFWQYYFVKFQYSMVDTINVDDDIDEDIFGRFLEIHGPQSPRFS